VIINSCIDFFFFADIVLNFRTTFFSPKTGEEIFEPKAIAAHYFSSGTLAIDLIATIPTDMIVEQFMGEGGGGSRTILQLFGLLKLIRIRRLSRIIMYMRARD